MSVYRPKRKDGTRSPWFSYTFVVNGVRFRGSAKTKVRREAVEAEARQRSKVVAGEVPRATIGLSAAFERYFEEHAQFLPSADDTDAQLERMLAGLGDLPMTAVTEDEISKYVARRRGQRILIGPKRKPGKRLVSNATVNREVELLRRVFRRARKVWKRAVADIDWTPLLLPEPKERVREASADEELRIIKALRDDLRPLHEWAIITGARFAGGARLTWPSVASDGTTTIRLKGGAAHVIPGTAALRLIYQRQKGLHPIYVFPYRCVRSRGQRKKGEWYPLSKNGWRKEWVAALKRAGVADFRFHDWRHTAGSRITRQAGIAVTQRLLGHTDIATTKRYAHVNQEDIRRAMEATASRVSGQSEEGAAAKPLADKAESA